MRRRMLTGLGSISVFLVLAASAHAVVETPFTVRFSTNDHGAIAIAGNTLATCPAAVATCAPSQAGTATGAALSNNAYGMELVDVDGDPGTFDSSTATFAPPAGATVLFAGLYWGARTTAGTGGRAASAVGARGTVLVRGPGGAAYQPLTGSVSDSAAVAGAYTGFADVTGLVAAGGPGGYTVANVQSGTGLDRYAGWALVIAYRSSTERLRNMTVDDGLATVQQGDPPLTITASGFTTPLSGPVRTSVGLVAYEGDRGSVGDRIQLNAQPLSDAANPVNNIFNSSISADGVDQLAGRTPAYVNQLGFDADQLATTGLIANGATSASVQLTTTLDQYLTQVVALTTDLSAPVLTAAKRVENVTRGGDGSAAQPGDVLRYTIDVTNGGDDAATDVTVSDPVPAGTAAVAPGGFAGSLPIGSLPAGASESASFEVRVAAGARDGEAIVNVATVAGRGATAGLPVTAVTSEVRTIVSVPFVAPPPLSPPPVVPPVASPPPAFEVTTQVTPSPPVAGRPAVTRIELENTTSAPVEDVVLAISVPGATLLSAEVTGGVCAPVRGAVVTCRVERVEAGERLVVRVRAVPRVAGRRFAPVVTVRGAGIPTQRVVVAGGRVARPAALRVEKTVEGSARVGRQAGGSAGAAWAAASPSHARGRASGSVRVVRPGQAVSYRIAVRSVGGVAVRGAVVCDDPASGLRLTSAPGARRLADGSACWRLRGVLRPGSVRTLDVTALVNARLVRDATLVNSARATAANVRGGVSSRARVRVAPLRPQVCGAAAAAGGPLAQAAC